MDLAPYFPFTKSLRGFVTVPPPTKFFLNFSVCDGFGLLLNYREGFINFGLELGLVMHEVS